MNLDNLEKRLQRQPLRQVPAEWRQELLNAACADGQKLSSKTVTDGGGATFWRVIFSRIPLAWGALAAVWLVVVATNGLLLGSGGSTSNRQVMAGTAEPFTVWQLQSKEFRLLASGKDAFPPEAPVAPPSDPPPRPRSERPHPELWGQSDFEKYSQPIA